MNLQKLKTLVDNAVELSKGYGELPSIRVCYCG